jgi:pSer/pThr/pTyr-binding forkhead associated (FHA) protein
MCAIAVNALFTSLRHRGTTRQLAGAIVACVLSALLLLPAIVWYEVRFGAEQAALSLAEIQVALVYITLWGWLLPLSATSAYCLFALPRTSTDSMLHLPRQKRSTRQNTATALLPPRHQPGVVAPFVFGDDRPWGWLEYRGGRFQGQRLALERSIITVGRDEQNDIWLDDDLASRYHAELAWEKGQVYLTDCESLNGVLLNGRRIRGVALLTANDLIEIGSHRFIFILADTAQSPSELSDPLAFHIWNSSPDAQNTGSIGNTGNTGNISNGSVPLPATRQLENGGATNFQEATQAAFAVSMVPSSDMSGLVMRQWQDTAEIGQASPSSLTPPTGAVLIRNGELADRLFLLDRPVIAVGRGMESDIMIEDSSISRRHVQFSHQPNGDYIQDLASRNGTTVNNQLLTYPHLLKHGDVVRIGNITLEYVPIQHARTAPLPYILTPQPVAYSISGPMPLRLPSKHTFA